jgi:hypothetical protein
VKNIKSWRRRGGEDERLTSRSFKKLKNLKT